MYLETVLYHFSLTIACVQNNKKWQNTPDAKAQKLNYNKLKHDIRLLTDVHILTENKHLGKHDHDFYFMICQYKDLHL